jgi:hypothetical protein
LPEEHSTEPKQQENIKQVITMKRHHTNKFDFAPDFVTKVSEVMSQGNK